MVMGSMPNRAHSPASPSSIGVPAASVASQRRPARPGDGAEEDDRPAAAARDLHEGEQRALAVRHAGNPEVGPRAAGRRRAAASTTTRSTSVVSRTSAASCGISGTTWACPASASAVSGPSTPATMRLLAGAPAISRSSSRALNIGRSRASTEVTTFGAPR